MAENTHLLIVEDDLDLSDMLAAYFHGLGYDVSTAAWGEEAVQIAQESLPDLIVLDIHLPDIDGYEVCRRLHDHRRTQAVPIIFLTARRNRGDKLSGLELGVVDYVTKPFDIQELALRVRNALQRARTAWPANPLTDLPEGPVVDEKLSHLLTSDSAWAILVTSIQGLDRFRELYGFVAADDVLRAVSLMIINAVNDAGHPDDFVGHITPYDVAIITDAVHLKAIRERIELRISQSIDYFYPLSDRDLAEHTPHAHRLAITTRRLDYTHGTFADLDALKTAVKHAPDAT